MTDNADEVGRKVISDKKLLALLNTACDAADKVASVNGGVRESIGYAAEHDNLNKKAWPTYKAVWKSKRKSHFDALTLIEDLRMGLDVIEAAIREEQGDLIADSPEARDAEFEAADPNKQAAAANSKALKKGIRKKKDENGKGGIELGKFEGQLAN